MVVRCAQMTWLDALNLHTCILYIDEKKATHTPHHNDGFGSNARPLHVSPSLFLGAFHVFFFFFFFSSANDIGDDKSQSFMWYRHAFVFARDIVACHYHYSLSHGVFPQGLVSQTMCLCSKCGGGTSERMPIMCLIYESNFAQFFSLISNILILTVFIFSFISNDRFDNI